MLVAEDDRADGVPGVGLVRVAEQHHRAAGVEDRAQLGRRQPDVEREEHAAGEQHAVVRLEQLVGVAAQPGDHLPGPHVEVALQGVAEPVAPVRRARRRSTAGRRR